MGTTTDHLESLVRADLVSEHGSSGRTGPSGPVLAPLPSTSASRRASIACWAPHYPRMQ
jgi:hypothetical protein